MMTYKEEIMSEQALIISESAIREMKTHIASDTSGEEIYFRVWVAGGGCSGLQYGLAIDTEGPEEGDLVVEQDEVKVLIDPLSLTYMSGSTIDFKEDDLMGGFKIDNPNAVSSCGCGNSFKTSDEDGNSGCGGCSGCG